MSLESLELELNRLFDQRRIIDKNIEIIEEKIVKNHSSRKFRCLKCNTSSKYSDVTLYESYYTERGLGYEDDSVHFSEYHIVCPHCNIHHRFLSKDVMEKYGIPYIEKPHYGSTLVKHLNNFGKRTQQFKAKFKNVTEGTDERNYNFVNVRHLLT